MERNMYLDKEKAVKAFMGTGEKNAAGEDLVTFFWKNMTRINTRIRAIP